MSAHATLPLALPSALRHPVAHLRQRMDRWFQSRLPRQDSIALTQRSVYILPTRPGLMLGVTLLTLLIASINYQLNLGYLLTFLLTGAAVVGMHVCHGTLRGLTMHLVAPDAQFAGGLVLINVQLENARKTVRYGIGMAVMGSDHWAWADVPAQGSTKVQIGFKPERRGLHTLPTLTAETRFPLGTFRVWTVWRPAAQALVYPAPEIHPPPLPPGEPRSGGAASAQRNDSGEYDGVRPYRRGDPLKLVVWKKVAKADELVSRDTQQVQRLELWLDLAQAGAPLEKAVSRLCAWVLAAEKRGLDYGLRLPGLEIAPNTGDAHRNACLRALAMY